MTYTDWQRHDHIREIQEYLRTIALTDNNYNELAVDGIYGTETAEAVRQYQLMNGLPVTGAVDSITWERLSADYLNALTLFSEAVPLQVFPSPQHRIRMGDRGEVVYILQVILNTLGDTADAIVITGEFDQATQSRVKELQKISGFEENGEVDRAFWDHLASWYNYA